MRWLVTVVVVVIIAFVGYRYFVPEEGTQVARQAGNVSNGVDLGQEIGIAVSDTVAALEGITDRASAEAALPSLQAIEGRLDELSGRVEQLSDEGREELASLLDDSLPELRELVSRVEAIEGAGAVIEPTLDDIMAKLDAWAEPPA